MSPVPQPFRLPLASALAPNDAVPWLRGDSRPFALVGHWLGGMTVLGSEPVRVAGPDEDPFALLDSQADLPLGEAAVGGGWVGWLGYGLGGRVEQLPPPPPAPVPRPAFSLAFYDHVVVFDGRRWWLEGLATEDREPALRERFAVWQGRLAQLPPRAPEGRPAPIRFRLAADGAGGHVSAIADCRRRIAAGELFQANLCVRLEGRFAGDPLELFTRALPQAQPRFGAFVDGVISLSPERFLRRRGRDVQSEPIKGTRPRVGPEPQRRAGLDSLLASEKDAAEHVMIVDLMRNDLGRVSAYGTVEVAPPRAEPHAGVWHLVSTVRSRLRDGVGDGALLRATFPPGSVTGAPKVQAMKVISALEATRREVYTGAIGIASPVAGLDLNVAIRTFELSGEEVWMGAGGGIVADSDPEEELEEALAKAAGPIHAIGGVLVRPRPGRQRVMAGPIVPDALQHGRRPNPAQGVFETVLVERGTPARLEQHLARLTESLRAVFDREPPADLRARAERAAASSPGRSRLRILAQPDGSVALTVSPAPPREPDGLARLAPFTLRGGHGGHKWRDRQLLDALSAAVPGMVPLLLDGDGFVLEAAYANVWIVEGEALITPPADRRILPGVTRSELLIGAPSAREEAIELQRLRTADQIFLTSSLSGRHPAELTTTGEAARAPALLYLR